MEAKLRASRERMRGRKRAFRFLDGHVSHRALPAKAGFASGCIGATRTDASYARLFSSEAGDKKSLTSREILPRKTTRQEDRAEDDVRVMSPFGMKLDRSLNAQTGGRDRIYRYYLVRKCFLESM